MPTSCLCPLAGLPPSKPLPMNHGNFICTISPSLLSFILYIWICMHQLEMATKTSNDYHLGGRSTRLIFCFSDSVAGYKCHCVRGQKPAGRTTRRDKIQDCS
ncbi:hypothetical protein SETIT_5G217400v2 [Setaria italica]|uniref:Uncharacterized protein n=1 Tax=Setaria italica TaxID=4555 RepID=A0A368R7A6_SETIT|nr:hypothetical protein SETIT_5G217400v2 [Setaria italica]RCV26087.1 hypothetical protein SETIT_5G217400v2 [Setaria italica]